MLNEETVPATKTLLTVVPRGPGPIAGNDYTVLAMEGKDRRRLQMQHRLRARGVRADLREIGFRQEGKEITVH